MGQRFAGALVDALVLGPVGVYLAVQSWETGSATWYWISAAIAAIYTIVPTALWGQTVGKRVVGTQVVTELPDADEPCSWRGAGLRYAVHVVPGMVPVAGEVLSLAMSAWIIGTTAFDGRHRGVHDRVAGTRVVDVRGRGRLTDRYRSNIRAATTSPRPVRKRRRARP
jgi:uncharacterized RDD family membrane protein YckC